MLILRHKYNTYLVAEVCPRLNRRGDSKEPYREVGHEWPLRGSCESSEFDQYLAQGYCHKSAGGPPADSTRMDAHRDTDCDFRHRQKERPIF